MTTDKGKDKRSEEGELMDEKEQQPDKAPVEDERDAPEEGNESQIKGSGDVQDAEDDPALADDVSADDVKDQLAAAREELTEARDRVLRVSAEFENYKKRSAREMTSHRKHANEKLIKALLPVVDNLELAIRSAKENGKEGDGLLEGVEMTHKEILKVFAQFGVTPIEAEGKPFDPAVHEAAMQEPSDDFPENTVIREFQKGYLIHERLLRPTMVVVSKGPEASGKEQSE